MSGSTLSPLQLLAPSTPMKKLLLLSTCYKQTSTSDKQGVTRP